MAKYVFDPNNDDGIRLPNPKTDPQGVPNSLPPTPGFGDPKDLGPAHSQFSTGRGCPECSGDLQLFEYISQDNLVLLRCKHCKKIWHEPDLESDELYRIISPSMVLRWMDRTDRAAQIRAKQEGNG